VSTNREIERPHRPSWRLPLFWKVLVLALAVSLVPLAFAMYMAVSSATDVTENLLKKNLLQMSKQVAERTSYTLVSIDSDLDVMGDVPLTSEGFVAFSRAQRRELYSESRGERRMEAVPKYREVAFYPVSGKPVIVVDDVADADPHPFVPLENRWCEKDDFVKAALDDAGEPVVSGLVGCHFSLSRYEPAKGRLGAVFDGGIRVSKAVLDEDGEVRGVATLVLSQLHLVWALQSLRRPGEGEDAWAMMVNRDGWVIAHPKPQFALGHNRLGRPLAGTGWKDDKSVNLLELRGSVGTLFREVIEAANNGTKSTSVIDEKERGHWVVASYPVEAEIGPYSPSRPMASVLVLYPREKALEVTGGLKRNLAVLIALTVLLVMLGSALLAGHISQPIRKLALAARSLARGEVKPVQADRGDEIGDLARAFNQMQYDLEIGREALLRAERLAAIGRFVSGIVHEVKNVLAGLGNYVTLLERKVDPELRTKVLGPMRRALGQMDQLVVRLRELALKPRFEETDLNGVLKHAAELIEAQARSNNVELTLDVPEKLQLRRADASLLGQVFLNLLINALECTPQGGKVQVTARREGADMVVKVRDTGPGLPDMPARRLLEPFFTTKPGGTGLGLYISNSIIERHNGLFEIGNHEEGGAVVEVRLPAVD